MVKIQIISTDVIVLNHIGPSFKIQSEILLLQPTLSKLRQTLQVKGTDKAYLFDMATQL